MNKFCDPKSNNEIEKEKEKIARKVVNTTLVGCTKAKNKKKLKDDEEKA